MLLLCALCATVSHAGSDAATFYVGTYTGNGSAGIYAYRFDATTGAVTALGCAAETANPSFIAVDARGERLYAVNELDTFQQRPSGAVSTFTIDRTTGMLTLLQQIASRGTSPAHIAFDREGHFVLVANYGSGSAMAFPINADGTLGPPTGTMQASGSSVDPVRQQGPHVHHVQASIDNETVFVCDLGIDHIVLCDFDETGRLTANPDRMVPADPGAGPRHLVLSASGKYVYVVNELHSTVVVYAYAKSTRTMTPVQTISTLAYGAAAGNTAAEIVLDKSGRTLYVSNRGADDIVVFRVDPRTGTLTEEQRVPCGGRTPRHITLDPSGRWLFCSNQGSDTITLFRVEQKTGQLSSTPTSIPVSSPTCVSFAPRRGARK